MQLKIVVLSGGSKKWCFDRLERDMMIFCEWLMEGVKGDLTPDEERELEALEGENMETIEKVYEAIKADRAIMSLIERIKSHEWVGVVEVEGGI